MQALPDTAEALIASLALEAHPEGGFFRRYYTSVQQTTSRGRERPLMSCIYYLLTEASPLGCLHRNRSDIVHFWQGGGALRYTLVHANGQLERCVLGPDFAAGQQLQLVVPGGCWKASELLSGPYGLISEAVCPGFDYHDHEFAQAELLRQEHACHWPVLEPLLRASRATPQRETVQ